MLKRNYDNQNCSIARALEIVGERWTLLIVRDAFLGRSRFDEFQESLGIARNVLTDRLNRLVEEGILERRRYSERPPRDEYRPHREGPGAPTRPRRAPPVGRPLPERAAAALLQRKSDGKPVVVAFVPEGAAERPPRGRARERSGPRRLTPRPEGPCPVQA